MSVNEHLPLGDQKGEEDGDSGSITQILWHRRYRNDLILEVGIGPASWPTPMRCAIMVMQFTTPLIFTRP